MSLTIRTDFDFFRRWAKGMGGEEEDAMLRLLAVAEAADLIHAHGPGKPMRMPDDCPLCGALRDLEEP